MGAFDENQFVMKAYESLGYEVCRLRFLDVYAATRLK